MKKYGTIIPWFVLARFDHVQAALIARILLTVAVHNIHSLHNMSNIQLYVRRNIQLNRKPPPAWFIAKPHPAVKKQCSFVCRMEGHPAMFKETAFCIVYTTTTF
ncbi:uncharacterized protein LOC124145566 [Haliotis rufescens]|uniref:uncharacterized protein LOC124145566 n=1 Tax=Haliotis rufescens TaxID=6454 RepID=UPI001EAFFEA9|nr:uncharacterized protein LOC124145566 [Haliotis rufescens]